MYILVQQGEMANIVFYGKNEIKHIIFCYFHGYKRRIQSFKLLTDTKNTTLSIRHVFPNTPSHKSEAKRAQEDKSKQQLLGSQNEMAMISILKVFPSKPLCLPDITLTLSPFFNLFIMTLSYKTSGARETILGNPLIS